MRSRKGYDVTAAPALVLALSLAMIMIKCPPAAADASRGVIREFNKWHVSITNGLTTGSAVVVHCTSDDDDLGERWLAPSEEYAWGFRENLLRNTRFSCGIRKEESHVLFNVFWEDPLLFYKCDWSRCFWTVKDDGIYLRDVPKGIDLFWIGWDCRN